MHIFERVQILVFTCLLGLLAGCGDGCGDDNDPIDSPLGPSHGIDADGDGFAADNDCDDQNDNRYPGAAEVCDNTDNNCDSLVDNRDIDQDGFYPPDCGGTDCDDSNALVHPDETESCNDLDDNCDGLVDEGVKISYFWDTDGDGYGDSSRQASACTFPAGASTRGEDCDDTNAAVHPGAIELCNALDDNCEGHIDEGLTQVYYIDADGDSFGAEPIQACDGQEGVAAHGGDCLDDDPTTYPGAEDAPGDGLDQDCAGSGEAEGNVGISEFSLSSIQEAIDQAKDDTTIWVGPGTYREAALDFHGKLLRLRSTLGPQVTIIDAESTDRVLTFQSGEGFEVLVEGFTITGGFAQDGGGILMDSSSPTVRNCVITGNEAQEFGGGVAAYDSDALFSNCTFTSNIAQYGGGLYLISSPVELDTCSILGNHAGLSGGISFWSSDASVHNSKIVGNYCQVEGGGMGSYLSTPVISNCTINGNQSLDAGGGLFAYFSVPILSNVVMNGNQSVYGGAAYLLSSDSYMEQSAIVGNLARVGGGVYLINTYGFPVRTHINGTVLAYNTSYNLYNDPTDRDDPDIGFSDFYNKIDNPNHNLATLDASNQSTEPLFLAYTEGMPTDLHLDQGSPLADSGPLEKSDPDGSRADIGAYGGAAGDLWDLDDDAFPDYFWPGGAEGAPSPFDLYDYDRDDSDPSWH